MRPVLTLAALALTACGKSNTTTNTTTATTEATNAAMPMPAAATGGQAFANTAAASDAFEIESSRLALANATAAGVKVYAQSMIDAHTASTASAIAS